MTEKVVRIALLHLRIVLEPVNMISLVLLPLLFTFLIGAATRGTTDAPGRHQLYVTNGDTGTLGAALLSHLNSNPMLAVQVADAPTAQTAVEQGTAVAALHIPPDFSTQLLAGQPVSLELFNAPHFNEETYLVDAAVQTATTMLTGSLQTAQATVRVAEQLDRVADGAGLTTPSEASDQIFEHAFTQAETRWQSALPLTLQVEPAVAGGNALPSPQGFNQASPGMLVMFSLFFLVTGGAVTFIEERAMGTLQRMLVLPIGKAGVMLGKLLGIYVSGALQISVLILAGVFLFKVNWGQAPLALGLVALSFALTATSMGLLLATLVRTQAQASALSTMLVMVISALGGAWWPLEIVPGWMQLFGHAFPSAWAMDGFHDIIHRGYGVTAILPDIAVLLGFAVICFGIGLWRFRYE